MTSVAGVDYLFFKGHRGTRALVVANVPTTRARELAEHYRERGWEMIVVGRFAVMGDGIAVEVITDQQTPSGHPPHE